MTDPLREVLWTTPSQLKAAEKRLRALINARFTKMEDLIMTNQERVDAGLENISGDLSRQGNEISQLSTDLGQARAQIADLLANQEAGVAAQVDAKLAEFADKVEALAAVVPEPEPAPEPTPEPEPVPNPAPETPAEPA